MIVVRRKSRTRPSVFEHAPAHLVRDLEVAALGMRVPEVVLGLEVRDPLLGFLGQVVVDDARVDEFRVACSGLTVSPAASKSADPC